MLTETRSCDVKDERHGGKITYRSRIPVVQIADENDGRGTEPYLSVDSIDMCANCYNKMLKTREMLTSAGAMGHSDVWFKSSERVLR